MPKYLIRSSYLQDGLKRLLREGGSSRLKATAQALERLGGTVEAFYCAFGETDVFVIVDLPSNLSATALSLLANAEGTRSVSITVLITPEEVDKATEVAKEMGGAYRPPGQ